MSYVPRPVPADQLQQFLDVEHRAIAEAIVRPISREIWEATNGTPTKPRDGTVMRADGVNWNPNSQGAGLYCYLGGTWVPLFAIETWTVVCSGETEAITSGTNKVRFRIPYACRVVAVSASLNVAQSSGTIWTVDINDDTNTILSTKLTVDNSEKTSATAATAAVISAPNIAADSEISIDFDSVGTGGQGAKVYIQVVRT